MAHVASSSTDAEAEAEAVIVALRGRPGGLTVHGLAGATRLGAVVVVLIVRDLVRSGVVERRELLDPGGSVRAAYVLTAVGRRRSR